MDSWSDVGIVPLQKAMFLQEPFPWIVFDVLPYFVIVLLIADHMVVVGTLKNGFSDFLRYEDLKGTHNIRYPIVLRCCVRRGRCPHRPIIQPYNHMNVIRHDYIFFNFRYIVDIFFCDHPVRFWDDVGIVPYDRG